MVKNEHALTAKAVLDKLLAKIEQVDFRKLMSLKNNDRKPREKNYVVVIIEQVLQIAASNNWGLSRLHDFIYIYNEKFWQLVKKDDFKPFLGEAAQKMGYNPLDAKHYEFRDKLYKQFCCAAMVSPPIPSKDSVRINLKNGTVEITEKGMVIRDFDKNDFLTYQLSFSHDPHAKCPLFMQFLSEMLPDEQLQEVLAEFFGYIFTKHLKLEKCLLLYGSGGNGKSVFFDIINSLP